MDEITEEEFCQRFTAELVRLAGKTDARGACTYKYAADVAPTYYAEEWQRRDGPEACAQADYDCWENDE